MLLVKTDATNADFKALVKSLDAYLAIKDGDEHAFYDQYNQIDDIRYVIVAYEEGKAVGCGAIKSFEPGIMEVKRMYTVPESRGKGIASSLLLALEKWAGELGCSKCILETGKRQLEAIRLYEKSGYKRIANYGQYVIMDNSVCFEKNV